MVGGRALGVVLISATIGLIAQHASWPAAFYTLAALTLLPLPLVLGIHETPRTPDRRFDWKAFSAFGRREVIALASLGALYSLIINATNQLVNPFMQDEFGIGISTAGFLTTVWGIGVVIGGMTGGRLADRLGQRRAVLMALLLALLAIFGLTMVFHPWAAWPMVALFGLAFGFYETVFFAISMRVTDPRIAASMFALLMAVANLGTGIGLGISGALAESLGFRTAFVIFAALNLAALPLLPVIFPREAPQKAGT